MGGGVDNGCGSANDTDNDDGGMVIMTMIMLILMMTMMLMITTPKYIVDHDDSDCDDDDDIWFKADTLPRTYVHVLSKHIYVYIYIYRFFFFDWTHQHENHSALIASGYPSCICKWLPFYIHVSPQLHISATLYELVFWLKCRWLPPLFDLLWLCAPDILW